MRKQVVELIKEMRTRGLVAEANQLASITKIAGRKVVERIGEVKIYKDSEWGEYIVCPKGCKPDDDKAYHTDDMEDAVMTARKMDEEKAEDSADDAENKDDKCPRIGAIAKDCLKMVMERVEKDLDDEALEELEEDLYDEIKSVLDMMEDGLAEKDDAEED